MSKYKAGQKKVFVVDGEFFRSGNYFDDNTRRICRDDDGVSIYLKCKKDDIFTEGDLVAVKCIGTVNEEESDWERIS